MDILGELVHYCKQEDPIGALMFQGEWGSGKTYLIEHDLKEALKDTHIIVRISLFGIGEAKAMQETVRQKWFEGCEPLLVKLHEYKEKNKGLSSLLNILAKLKFPVGDIVSSLDIMSTITIKPKVKDIKTQEEKKVVLVFDDVERSRMNPLVFYGLINEYRENQHFNVILVSNMESFSIGRGDNVTYQLLKNKVVSETVSHVPDPYEVIHSIIANKKWRTKEYGLYLADKEKLIADVFACKPEEKAEVEAFHNFLSLIEGLESFYRVFYHLTEEGKEVPDKCLTSFLAYFMVSRNGLRRSGQLSFEYDDEDIRKLYPVYDDKYMPASLRNWIADGLWDKEAFLSDIEKISEN